MDKPKRSGLRQARLDRGWTQEEAADQIARLAWLRHDERVGVNADMIAKWERGEKSPSPRYRELLCLLYGATPEYLGIARIPKGKASPPPETVSPVTERGLVDALGGAAAILDQLGTAGGDPAAADVRHVERRSDTTPDHAQTDGHHARGHGAALGRRVRAPLAFRQAHPGQRPRPGAAGRPVPGAVSLHRPRRSDDARGGAPVHAQRPAASRPRTDRTTPVAGQPRSGRHPRRSVVVFRPARPDGRPGVLQPRAGSGPRGG